MDENVRRQLGELLQSQPTQPSQTTPARIPSPFRNTLTPSPLQRVLAEVNEHVKVVMSDDFAVNVSTARNVPAPDDRGLTFDNLDANSKDCKVLESCVLYIDIRDSSRISVEHQSKRLAKLYSAFAKSMVHAAGHFGGTVRNIVGDRIMVVFDPPGFTAAVSTALLFHTIASELIASQFPDFRCGIGVDYGKMLVTKVGSTRHGNERDSYRSLVWLGEPANTASKLTDLANKSRLTDEQVRYSLTRRSTGRTFSFLHTPKQFFQTVKSALLHDANDTLLVGFQGENAHAGARRSPILVTSAVYNGFKAETPQHSSLAQNLWVHEAVDVPGYSGNVYGVDAHFKDVANVR